MCGGVQYKARRLGFHPPLFFLLVAEIVIKPRREMDALIGLDTNYQKERHLCKFSRSFNFYEMLWRGGGGRDLGDASKEELVGGGGEKRELPSLIPADETLILV